MMDLDLIKTGIVAVILSYATLQDIEKREVDDWIWIILAILTIPLTIYQYVSTRVYLTLHVLSMLMGAGLALSFAFMDLMGGADAKAFIVLSIIELPSFNPLKLIPSLSIMLNSILFSLITIPYILTCNLLTCLKRKCKISSVQELFLLFVAKKIKLGEVAKNPHKYFIIGVEDKLRKVKASEETINVVKELLSRGYTFNTEVYVTPSLPLMLFILLGYLFYKLLGNVLYLIIHLL